MKKEKETQIDRQREKEIERQSASERYIKRYIIYYIYIIYRNGKDKETIVARENKNGKK